MRITVLGGSPKGAASVTMQYMKYIEKRFPGHDYEYHQVAQRISLLERDPEKFQTVVDALTGSDLVVWAFPVYYMLCCAQYRRFMELLLERCPHRLKGIPATILTTSIRFYDHTAHNYIQRVCSELGMPFCGGYSAESSDLFKGSERERLVCFFQTVLERVGTGRFQYTSAFSPSPTLSGYVPEGTRRIAVEGRWMVLADLSTPVGNLGKMVSTLVNTIDGDVEMVDISRVDFKPCRGCCRCGPDNVCIHGEDPFIKLHRDRVRKADVVIIAGVIKSGYLSSVWKRFFDRSFYMGHTPVLKGRQLGFLISGSLASEPNLREILLSWSEFQETGVPEIVTDEVISSTELDTTMENMVRTLEYARQQGFVPPPTFRRTGGHKLFRDYIWGELRPLFQADHRYYRRHGLYDFPHRRLSVRLMNLFLPHFLRLPPVKKKMLSMMPGAMLTRFRKLVG